MPAFGLFQAVDQLNDSCSYYLAETDGRQLFVTVSRDFIEYSELTQHISEKKFEIGSNTFTKIGYILK